MAVNKKGGSVNEILGDVPGPEDFGLANLGRLEEQHGREPIALRELRRRAQRTKVERLEMNKLAEQSPSVAALPEFQQEVKVNTKATGDLEHRIRINKIAGRERVNAQAVNIVGREYSDRAINSYVSNNTNSLESQVAGSAAAGQGYGGLEQRRSEIMNQMQGLRQDSTRAAGEYMQNRGVNPASRETLQGNATQMKDLAQQLIPITVGMQQLKQQGLDPQGRQHSLINTGDKASNLLSYNKLEDEMKSGKGLGAFNPAELKKKEAAAAEKLIKALEELRGAAGKTKEELEGLNENAETAAEEFEDISKARKMPGGESNISGKTVIVAGAVAEALGLITTAMQNILITQPLQMVQNVQGAANIENEKYSMWHQALAGDMTARMTLGAWDTGDAFGEQLANRKGIIHVAAEVGHGIAGVTGVAQVVQGLVGTKVGTVVGNPTIEYIAQGGKSAFSGALGVLQEELAREREIEKGALRIQGTHTMVNAHQALNHITGAQLQQYRNYTMGLNEAAGQMGGQAGEDFLNDAAGTKTLERMEKSGVGVKEMGALASTGAQMMGSMFKKEHVFQAVGLENLGFGTSDQNMKRMGILGAAGTGDPGVNLAKLIEEGMLRGLSGSKAIDMIVDNTAKFTEETALRGELADPTDFLKSIMGAMDKDNPNKVLAGKIAYQTYQDGESARHNISSSFPGTINVDRNMKDLGLGTDRFSGAVATHIPTAMLNAMKGKSKEEQMVFFERQGVNVQGMDPYLFEDDKAINILNRNASSSELAMQSGVGYAVADPGAFNDAMWKHKDDSKYLDALITGRNPNLLTDEDRNNRKMLAGAAGLQDKNFAAIAANAFTTRGGKLDADTQKTVKTLADMEAEKSTRKEAQVEKRMGNIGEVGQAKQGGKVLGADAGGAAGIKTLADTARIAFAKAGEDAERRFGKAASETATAFGKSAMYLDKASGKLDAVAGALAVNTNAAKVVSKSFAVIMKNVEKSITAVANAVMAKVGWGN